MIAVARRILNRRFDFRAMPGRMTAFAVNFPIITPWTHRDEDIPLNPEGIATWRAMGHTSEG